MAELSPGEIFFQPLAHGTIFAISLALREAMRAAASGQDKQTINPWLAERKAALRSEIGKVLPEGDDRKAAFGVLDLIFAPIGPGASSG
jgi:hypothetical protein